jgi:hypothetical protein
MRDRQTNDVRRAALQLYSELRSRRRRDRRRHQDRRVVLRGRRVRRRSRSRGQPKRDLAVDRNGGANDGGAAHTAKEGQNEEHRKVKKGNVGLPP